MKTSVFHFPRLAALLVVAGLALAANHARAQFMWTAYDDSTGLPATNGINCAVGGDLQSGTTVQLSIPAGKTYLFATSNFSPITFNTTLGTLLQATFKVNMGGFFPNAASVNNPDFAIGFLSNPTSTANYNNAAQQSASLVGYYSSMVDNGLFFVGLSNAGTGSGVYQPSQHIVGATTTLTSGAWLPLSQFAQVDTATSASVTNTSALSGVTFYSSYSGSDNGWALAPVVTAPNDTYFGMLQFNTIQASGPTLYGGGSSGTINGTAITTQGSTGWTTEFKQGFFMALANTANGGPATITGIGTAGGVSGLSGNNATSLPDSGTSQTLSAGDNCFLSAVGTNATRAVAASAGANTFFIEVANPSTTSSMTISLSQLALNQAATIGSSTASSSYVPSGPPAFQTQPQSITFGNAGSTTSSSLTASAYSSSGTPTYRWYFNGTALSDGTESDGSTFSGTATATLTLNDLSLAYGNANGQYTAVATNTLGSTTSSGATVTVIQQAPASFTTQPVSATILNGNSATFSATIFGTDPIAYTWSYNGTVFSTGNVASGTTLTPVTTAAPGSYSATISNQYNGSPVTSSTVTLTSVSVPEPQTLTPSVPAGSSVTFSIAATGGNSITYQWYLNGTASGNAVSGATSSTLTLPSVTQANAGSYYVAVSGDAGSVIVGGYLLTVLDPTLGMAVSSPLLPAAGATSVPVDAPFFITFNQAVTMGTHGIIHLYNSSGSQVDSIDLTKTSSVPTSWGVNGVQNGTNGQRSLSGFTFNYFPVIINSAGTTAQIQFPSVTSLTYGTGYYITIDPGVFVGANGAYSGLTSGPSAGWYLSAKASAPTLNGSASTTLNVAADLSGDFATVQGALDFLYGGGSGVNYTSSSAEPVTLFIHNGAYEQLVCDHGLYNITFQGQSETGTILEYPNNPVLNSASSPYHRCVFVVSSQSGSSTLQTLNTTIENMTIQSLTPKNATSSSGGTQCEALDTIGNQTVLSNVIFSSFQDTLQTNGETYVSNCHVTGDVDFNWGVGPSFYTNCELTMASTGGYFVQSRNATQPSGTSGHGYVFVDCTLDGAGTASGAFLARDGGFPNNEAVYINATIVDGASPLIATAGWSSGTTNSTYNWSWYNLMNGTGTANSYTTSGFLTVTPATAGDQEGIAALVAASTGTPPLQTPPSFYETASNVLNGWSPALAPASMSDNGQPVSSTTTSGGSTSYTFVATGSPTPTYQWYANTTNSTTGGVLIAAGTTTDSDGNVVDVGTQVSGSVTTGDGSVLTVVDALHPAFYYAVATNSQGSVVSSAVALNVGTPPSITSQPQSQTVTSPGAATFSASASGSPSPTYQWYLNGSNLIAGASSSSYPTPATNPGNSFDGNSYTVVATNSSGSAVSNPAVLTVYYTPIITTQPQSQPTQLEGAGTAGAPADTMTVVAVGDPTPTYQWYVSDTATADDPADTITNGLQDDGMTEVSGATTSTLSAWDVGPGINSSNVFVLVSNSVGSVGSNQISVSTLYAPGFALQNTNGNPSQEPQNQTVLVIAGTSTTATFTSNAPANPAATYQWYLNGTAVANQISGATSENYTTPVLSSANNGSSYAVIATNSQGSSVSTTATLTVDFLTITSPPTAAAVNAGSPTTFTVVASGNPSATYQWYANTLNLNSGGTAITGSTDILGNAVTGATSATLGVTPVQTGTGYYYCVVSNAAPLSVASSPAQLTVHYAPTITSEPTGVTVTVPNTGAFSVGATGNPAPTYQWNVNGTAISGASSSSYTTPATASSNNGDSYTVTVSNSVGSITSFPAATLTVDFTPSITTQPASQTVTVPAAGSFSVVATGNPAPTYQWNLGGTAIAGASSSSYATPATSSANNGASYTVTVSNSAGSVTSSPAAILTVDFTPSITTQPASQTVTVPATGSFSVVATGNPAPSYQWNVNGTAISGASSSSYTTPTTSASNNGDSYTVTVSNSAGSVTSSPAAILTVDFTPSITTQPASQTVTVPAAGSFSVVATGNPAPTYQWNLGGTAIAGASSSSYATPATSSANNGGSYTVTVSNSAGSVTSSPAAILTVDFTPSITTQPASQTVTVPAAGSFSVVAMGNPAPSYQWNVNGTAISGASSSSYATPATSASNNGDSYTVTVSNSAGSVTSSPAAILTVDFAPSITTQPLGQTVNAGGTATFTAAASGNPAPAYQWTLGGTAIAGASSSTLSVPSVTVGMSGNVYAVTASNGVAPNATSSNAILTVVNGPAVSITPSSLTLNAGADSTGNVFTASAGGSPAPAVQWYTNTTNSTTGGTAISGSGTDSLGNTVTIGSNSVGTVTTATLTVTNTVPAGSGYYYSLATNSAGSALSNVVQLTVDYAPSFTSNPLSQTVTAPAAATFTAAASGNPGVTYQWYLNGTTNAIAGASSSSYPTPATSAGSNGSTYTVIATNSLGSAVSATATLTVDYTPSIITQPASQAVNVPATAAFSVVATGNPVPTYQWNLNGTAISGATSPSYTTPATMAASNGASYTVTVSNSAGSVTSSPAAILTVDYAPSFTVVQGGVTPVQPVSQTATAPAAAIFTATASGNPAAAYQWYLNGTTNAIAGASSSSYTTPATSAGSNGSTYTVIATNGAGSAVSATGTLTVDYAPSITTQPASQSVNVPATGTFSVVATGNPVPTYQWNLNGTAISGATSPAYTTPATSAASNGASYTVTVSNSVGSVTSSPAAILTVDYAPSITTQPTNSSVLTTQTATFTVVVTGNPAPSIQWLYDGGPLSNGAQGDTSVVAGATSSTLVVSNAQLDENNGSYAAVVSNSVGSVTSSVAALDVTATVVAPSFTLSQGSVTPSEPSNQSVTAPAPGTFVALASGTSPAYQWYLNGTANGNLISGATSSSYTTGASSDAMNGGVYYVLASNATSSVFSTGATLTVTSTIPQLVAPFQSTSVSVPLNGSVTLTETLSPTESPVDTITWTNSSSVAISNGTQLDGSVVSGAGTTALTISNAQPNEFGGSATFTATNSGGSATQTVTIQVVIPPAITTQPVSATPVYGTAGATLTVAASGTAPSYQWYANTTNLAAGGVLIPAGTSTDSLGNGVSGQASATLTFTNPVAAGFYYAVASNIAGSAASNAVSLTASPAITSGPQPTTVNAGSTANFAVTASASPAPAYQWNLAGNPIPGASSATYTTPVTAAGDNGSTYTVTVSNSAGSVTSGGALLTVDFVPSITTQPSGQTVTVPAAGSFSVAAAGNPSPTYQWNLNGTAISGATSPTYTTPATSAASNGASYTVTVSNSVGSVTSSPAAILTVDFAPTITTQPAGQTVTVPTAGTFSVAVTGNPAPTYQWNLNGTAVPGASSAAYTTPLTSSASNGASYTVTVSNSVGSVTSSPAAILTVDYLPSITTQPAGETVTVPTAGAFSVVATGNPSPTYQWNLNGSAISGATSPSYVTPATSAASNGASYTVTVSNSVGSVTSSPAAILTVDFAPTITTQPAGETVTVPTAGTFSVAVTGNPAPTYQWNLNGTAVPGASSATYTTPATSAASNGASYTVTVSNSIGSVTSSPAAILTVDYLPSITTEPASQTVSVPATAGFSVVAAGNPAPTYQWSLNGTAITGATSPSYTTPATSAANNGASYTVTVSNSVGSVTSSPAAILTVDFAPTITTQPVAPVGTVVPGAGVSFTVAASGNPAPTYQWYFNTSAGPIAGATSSTYSIPSAAVGNTGSYFAVATNGLGSATSITVSMTVGQPTVITTQPSPVVIITPPGTATFTVVATGIPSPTYQWSYSGTLAGPFVPIFLQTSSTLALSGVTASQGGYYEVTATNAVSSVISTAVELSVAPVITAQPVAVPAVTVPATATFTVAATGFPAPTYQWNLNGSAISGATSTSFTTPATTAANNGGTYSVTVSNSAGSVVSNGVVLTVDYPPTITTQPTSATTVTAPATATFSVLVTGNPAPSYLWALNGTTIAGATSASYTTPPTTAAMNQSSYTVTVSNGIGSAVVSSAAVLTVDYAPTFTTQPTASETVNAGSPVTFASAATGNPLPTYQWSFNGTLVAGQTSASYTINTTSLASTGSYTVTASNLAGSVTSTASVLTVDSAPAIVTQPVSQSVAFGSTVNFSVVVTGAPAPSYQWSFGSTAILGANSASYTLGNATAANVGSYSVTVSNSLGSVTSAPATLAVGMPNLTYFGSFGGGNFAIQFNGNGTGVMLAYDPTSGLVVAQYSFTVNGNGGFTITGSNSGGTLAAGTRGAQSGATPDTIGTFTITGIASGSGVTATVTGVSGLSAFASSGGVYPSSGGVAGFYQAGQLGGSATNAVIVSGPSSGVTTFYSLSDTVGGVVGATGTVAISGSTGTLATTSLTGSGNSETGSVTTGGTLTAQVVTSASTLNFSGGTAAVQATVAINNVLGTAEVASGDNAAVSGFVIAGTARPILILGLGPELSGLQPSPVLATPQLNLYTAGTAIPVASNTNWSTAVTSSATQSASALQTAANTDLSVPLVSTSADSGILTNSTGPGVYTAVLSGGTSTPALGMLEVYDTGSVTNGQFLANTSTRGFVAANGNLVHGFVVTSSDGSPVRVLVRAIGPGLAQFAGTTIGSSTALLGNPTLTVYNSSGAPQGTANANWTTSPDGSGGSSSNLAAAGSTAGAFALSSSFADSAMILSLAPGTYTAVAAGNTGQSGVVLVEVYVLP